MPFSKDFIAASSVPIILSILEHGDSYGYAIIQNVREISGGELEWSDGMLYPVLHRLEKKGLISSYWGQSNSGRKRKYYKLEQAGSTELGVQLANWKRLHEILLNMESK
ncbi:MAG: PadR family transcriptional regulator [Calditrichia bacterium]